MLPLVINGSINLVGYGIAVLGSGIGVAIIFMALINGTARQPEARSAMFSSAMIGFAVVEALAILGFVLAFVVN